MLTRHMVRHETSAGSGEAVLSAAKFWMIQNQRKAQLVFFKFGVMSNETVAFPDESRLPILNEIWVLDK